MTDVDLLIWVAWSSELQREHARRLQVQAVRNRAAEERRRAAAEERKAKARRRAEERRRQQAAKAPWDGRNPPTDPFEVLGIPRGSTHAAIKGAYRSLVKRHHPDRSGNVEVFKVVDRAYKRLIG